jgi:hypothetical protein
VSVSIAALTIASRRVGLGATPLLRAIVPGLAVTVIVLALCIAVPFFS